MGDPSAYSITQLQTLAREYNEAYSPIPLKQSKAALFAQLDQRRVFAEEAGQDRVANLIDAVAREVAIWALQMEDKRRYEERRGNGYKRKRSKRLPISEGGAQSPWAGRHAGSAVSVRICEGAIALER